MVVLPAAKWPGLVPCGRYRDRLRGIRSLIPAFTEDERLGSLAGTEPALPWYAPEVDRQDGLANASPRANTQPAKIGTHQDRTINTRTLPGAAHDIVTPTRSFCRNRARRHGGLGECRRRARSETPDILAAKVRSTSDGTFDFDVTVSSPYDTPQRYADAFRVMGKDGEVHGERTLFHDHATEQPFTRDLYNVKIPREVRMVVIQGATSALAMAARPSRSCCPGGSHRLRRRSCTCGAGSAGRIIRHERPQESVPVLGKPCTHARAHSSTGRLEATATDAIDRAARLDPYEAGIIRCEFPHPYPVARTTDHAARET